ncbi:MAG: rod shape-determining protein MreC [Bacteroides sp.]|nr:rod shape-determining protein MreC [Ruminococcus flavefaciens]MCM1554765.1 rod shape-determining protein MreC [Bacteroides sp.]
MKTIFQLLKRNFYVLLFLALEAVALTLYFRYHQQQESRLYGFCTGVKGVFMSSGEYRSKADLRRENARLQRENARLRAGLETSYLQTVHFQDSTRTDSLYRQMYVFLPARIVNGHINQADNYFLLDAGRDEGVEPGMAVISPNGIVGIVDKVSQHFSSVISVLHRQSMVSVRLAASGHSGSLTWPGVRCDEAVLSDIPSHVPVRVGDKVVTSGLSVVYPGGIPVGFVSEIAGKEDDFYRLKIQFSEDYRRIDRVYVVKNLYKEDIEACRQASGKI